MGNLLYTIAVILVIFGQLDSLHSVLDLYTRLLVIAVIAILFRLIQGRSLKHNI
jgi:type IV secretory pathway VirB2 component (pilin)